MRLKRTAFVRHAEILQFIVLVGIVLKGLENFTRMEYTHMYCARAGFQTLSYRLALILIYLGHNC